MNPLSTDEVKRYARHLVLRDFGGVAQQKLKAARVLVVGAGGLGSPVLAYLAGAGVGALRVIDHDTVGLSNLQRQIVHRTGDIGIPKVESASRFAQDINPFVTLEPVAEKLTAANAAALMQDVDLVVDGTDDFGTRRIVANAARQAGKMLVSGAVSMWDGQVTVFAPDGAGFDDLYPFTPDAADLPSCEAVGVLGPLTGIIGTLMAMEVLKILTGTGTPLVGRLLLYDGRSARFTEIEI